MVNSSTDHGAGAARPRGNVVDAEQHAQTAFPSSSTIAVSS
jgi:hypothetical protein